MKEKLYTIISRETIKPSSPTPPHLQTYNLSGLDQFVTKSFLPLVLFYPDCGSTSHDKATVLKKSLSQCLTQYYPFAGRMITPTTPYVDCNDEGVVFLEARINTPFDTFLNFKEQDEKFYQLFANDMGCYTSPSNYGCLVLVQLNHFSCGGIGLAVSMSHIIGDVTSLASFLSHWACLARDGSTDLKPIFIDHSPHTDYIPYYPPAADIDHINLVAKKFVFPNSTLNELKEKVVLESIINPTRVEVLTSLLYKNAVATATTKSGGFTPSRLFMMANVRDKCGEKVPQATFGNYSLAMMLETKHASETTISMVVALIKKHKLQYERIPRVQVLIDATLALMGPRLKDEDIPNGAFWCSSFCGFGFNKLDFGWGNPLGTVYALRSSYKDGFVLIDAPNGDGIEAWVLLEKEDMVIFENDKELLSCCQSY